MPEASPRPSATAHPTAPPVIPDTRAETACPPETSAGTPVPPGAPSLSPGDMLGHYRLVELLGRGGMGQVYRAEDTGLGRPVALKIMHPELAAQPTARERFLREARSVAAVRDDHVVTIYEVGQAGDVPFLAMELLRGQTLEEWLRARPVPPLADVVRFGREIAAGLAAAQECGLVHRDVKPANVWLEAPSGRAKILDFGLARSVGRGAGLTHTGDVLGTPSYMSPEQALGNPVDGRSDLFSLGALLYRLATGQLPFQGTNVTAVLLAVTRDPPRPVQELNPLVPPALDDLIMRLLEKEPDRRPASAAEVTAALRAMEAQGPSGWETVTPLTRRPASAVVTSRAPSPPAGVAARLKWFAGVALALVAGATVSAWWASSRHAASPAGPAAVVRPVGLPIRVGVLYSRTGTMAVSERPVLDGALLAVDEINEQGGVLGRPVEAVIEDGESDETVFAARAAKLIQQDHAAVLVGCWTSASRKAVKAVVERQDHLLLYPIGYEGMEQSENIVYGGEVPNQQILPALKWCYGFLNKKRWYLVGSDSIYSHAAHAVVEDEARALGSEVVGNEFVPLGSTDVGKLVRRIRAAQPDLIINTIAGDTNVAFFRALHRAGIRADQAPTLSFNLSEEELSGLTPREVVGHYAAGSYFQSLDLPENRAFLRRVQARFGPERIVTDSMQTAYTLVHCWARAVRAAGSDDVRAVRAAIKGQPFNAPEGPVTIDPATLHTVQVSRVGRIDECGRFQEVFLSPRPVIPEPFPASRSREAWEAFLNDLHRRWGGRWVNPGGPAKPAHAASS